MFETKKAAAIMKCLQVTNTHFSVKNVLKISIFFFDFVQFARKIIFVPYVPGLILSPKAISETPYFEFHLFVQCAQVEDGLFD